MRTRSPFLAAATCAVLVSLPTAAQADSITRLRFSGSGVEAQVSQTGPVSVRATNSFGFDEIESDNVTGSPTSDSLKGQWSSKAADVESNMSASVDGLTLKTKAHLEGAVAPSDVIVNCPYVYCTPDNYVSDWNWESFSFESYVEAMATDRGSIVSPTGTPSSFRLVFGLDGLNTSYLDFFNVNGTPYSFTGGGYEAPMFLLETAFNYNYGAWGADVYSELHYYRSDNGSTVFNPRFTGAPATDVASVMTDAMMVGPNGAWDVNLWLYSRARADFTNLDAGRLLFLLESDYSHTVTLRGFEVFDAHGRLLPDAVVTGSDGRIYPTSTGQPPDVPEPASVLLLGLGMMAAARRLRRVRPRLAGTAMARRASVALGLVLVHVGLATPTADAAHVGLWSFAYEFENGDERASGSDSRNYTMPGWGSFTDTLDVTGATPGFLTATFEGTVPTIANIGLLQSRINVVGGIGGPTAPNGWIEPWSAGRWRGYSAATMTDRLQLVGVPSDFQGDMVFTWSLDGENSFILVSNPATTAFGGQIVPLDDVGVNLWLAGDLYMHYTPEGGDRTFQRIHRAPLFVTDLTEIWDPASGYTAEQTQGMEFLPDPTLGLGYGDFVFNVREPVHTALTRSRTTVPFEPGTWVNVDFTMNSIAVMSITNIDHPGIVWDNDAAFQSSARLERVELIDRRTGHLYSGEWSLVSAEGYIYPTVTGGPGDPVAEPASLLLVGLGLVTAACRRVRR